MLPVPQPEPRGRLPRAAPAPVPVRVVRAARSPSGLVMAGAGAVIALLAGAPASVVVTVAVVLWLLRIALGVLAPVARGVGEERPDRILPYSLSEPWRGFVLGAVALGQRFDSVAAARQAGPVHDQLQLVGHRIRDGVRQAWEVARKGEAVDQAVAALDATHAERQASEIRARIAGLGGGAEVAELQRTLSAIEMQLQSAARLREVSSAAADRLRLLNAQLGEAVAKTVELSLAEPGSVDAAALSGVSSNVDAAVKELEALQQGLDEAGDVAQGFSTPGPEA